LHYAQLPQKDRAAGCVSFGQKWKTGTARQYLTVIIVQTLTQLACKAIKLDKKRQIWAITNGNGLPISVN